MDEGREFTFTLDARREEKFEAMLCDLGLGTDSEDIKVFMSCLLTFMEWAISEQRKGRTIGALDEESGTFCELGFEPFKNIPRNPPD